MATTTGAQPAHDSGIGRRIDVRNPATGEFAGSVPATDPAEVARVLDRAREAQERWGSAPFEARARVMRRFHDAVLASSERLLDTIQSESGKTRRDALAEVVTVAGTTRYYLAHGRRFLRDSRHQAAVPLVTKARVVRKPLGLVGLITPWNYPLLLGIGDAIPALLAGNAVVTKPSEQTPLSAQAAIDLLHECGVPHDLVQAVHGPGSELGPPLIAGVDYIGFTGSTEVGRKVAVSAAERLIPFSLELGGKNPMIVLPGARVDDAVAGLLNGAFFNSGQTCISIERVYVHDSMYDRFVQRAAERTRAMKVGYSTGWDCDMGSLASVDHADKVEAHITEAVQKGARVVTGGARRRDLGEAFIEPTILEDVTDTMAIAREETFGPVVSVYRVQDEREAIRLANESSYGLNASVWAGDNGRALEVARGLSVGSAGINSTLLVYNSFDVPMGGVRESGIGRRHGQYGITRYTQETSVVTSFARGGGYESVAGLLTSQRRANALIRFARAWRHIPGMR